MPVGIYKHKPLSEEHKKNISLANKGQIPWLKGKHHSEETRKKISENHKGMLGKYHSEEAKKKMSEWHKGKPLSEEHRENMKKAGEGKHRGEKSHFWKGGISPIRWLIRASSKYKQWRQNVFIRDNFTCQECGARSGNGKAVYLEAHHKISFSELIEEIKNYLPLLSLYEGAMLYTPLWEVSNGKTLCEKCHKINGRPKKFRKYEN